MIKRLLIIMMSLLIVTSGAYAVEQTYVSGYNGIKTTPVRFEGSFSGGSVMTVSMDAVKPSGDAESAVMVVTVYKNKKLQYIAKTETKEIASTQVSFSAEVTLPDSIMDESGNIDCEINAALIKTANGYAPVSSPAFYPTREKHKPLRDLHVDGASIDGFQLDKNEYVKYIKRYASIEDYNNNNLNTAYPEIVGYAADGGTKIDVSIGGELPGEGIVSATASDGSTLNYSIDFRYYVHVINGAASDDDFETDSDTYDCNLATYTKPNLRTLKAVLCSNLHGNPDSADGSVSGSRWATDGTALTNQRHEICYVADEYLGCDYYVFNNVNRATYREANYQFVSFTLEEDAEVIILDYAERQYDGFDAPEKTSEIQITGRYLNGTSGSKQVAPTYALAGRTVENPDGTVTEYNNIGATCNYRYKTAKVFSAGDTVTVTALNEAPSDYRCPVIVIRPL